MVKHLHHLLPCHGLLNIAVQSADCSLLGAVKLPAPPAYCLDRLKHDRYHHDGDQSQPHIRVNHKGKGSYNVYGSRYKLYHRPVQHLAYRIHIIGKAAHHIPMVVGVIITYRKFLQFSEQVITQFYNGILGDTDHDPLL